jgi:hypothetical protein
VKCADEFAKVPLGEQCVLLFGQSDASHYTVADC